MKHLNGFRWLIIALMVVLCASFIFSFPVWKHNRYTHLKREEVRLQKELDKIQDQMTLTELQRQRLFDRARIESFASERLQLGYNNPPILLEVNR